MQFNCAYTELVSISKLVPNPKNANKHSTEQIERLAKIIDFQGQRSPVVVSKRSGFITKGHGRLMAMQKLGWENIAVDYQDYLSEAQEYADIVADNEIARWAELDVGKLREDFALVETESLELLGLKDLDILSLDNYEESFGDWNGMPDMGDNTGTTEKAFGKIIVWFESELFFDEFKKTINQDFTLGKKSVTNNIWFPKK